MGGKRKLKRSRVNSILVPDDGGKMYALHVQMRSDVYVKLLYNVACLCLKYNVSPPYTKYMTSVMSILK